MEATDLGPKRVLPPLATLPSCPFRSFRSIRALELKVEEVGQIERRNRDLRMRNFIKGPLLDQRVPLFLLGLTRLPATTTITKR